MKRPGQFRNDRKDVARFMRRLYACRLTSTSGGNISYRVRNDIIAITPSATDKGRMRGREVALISLDGTNLTEELKPSIETGMHLSIYRKKDTMAIVHAHPVFATAFTAMKDTIDTALTAEAIAILGDPLFVPYALMGSAGLADIVSEYSLKSDILLLENHGILATGATLLEAFDKIEVLENAAKMTVIVSMMGKKRNLSWTRINEIKKIFG